MNLFTFRKMEEDHFTNILTYILSSYSYNLLPSFLNELLNKDAKEFEFEELGIELFSKKNSRTPKNIEYIIGIAPFKNFTESTELENNLDSIPDAWIYGKNFTLLFEFKIRGSLDNAQLTAHKTKLSRYTKTIKFQWEDIILVLKKIKKEANEIQNFLIEEFIISSTHFNSKRRSSGMPNEIIGGIKKTGQLYFIITGSKEIGIYTVDVIYPNGVEERLREGLKGIQESRRWIANYVMKNHQKLSLQSINEHTVLTDFCIKPGRIKNSWNQWRLGSYLDQNENFTGGNNHG
ncbi:hypothetical protein [Gottfriedia acidiceleris]|uniref:GIY-YIG homing endonuclease n=1 Tax=Gottfriedia acidiceleris TaxID=371036 RepID=A0ABY4JUQ4_9BACI|nr:hypothetical protein [Gottfriedia acidiceleris]UPM56372.1 hypothetical protein MY490_11265 [Gottfriedia acidiceleris]